jgi:1-acyl-sn-glycerol-3-phosphate acyltransferase
MRAVLSTLFWLFLAATSIALFAVALLIWAATAPFDRRLRALHQYTCFWASLYTWINPAWPVEVIGREKIRPDETYVMVANHLSLLDILVLFRLFAHFKWVSKIENFRIPCVGWNMHLNGYIPLRRGDRTSILRMIRSSLETLEKGSSVMLFPEGTRSPSGRMRLFKPGAFEIALTAKKPILPIAVEGTAQALPKRGFVLQGRHPIRVTVLEPLPYASFAGDDIETLTRRVRTRIAEVVEEKEPLPAA